MAHQLILVPAYGRVYETPKQALADWKAGKDFKIANGPYCSIRDLPAMQRMNNHILMQITYLGFSEIFAVA